MSYTRLDAAEPVYGHEGSPLLRLGRLGRIALWSVANALLLFAEQLAEIAAPLCLLAGAVWYAIPKALAAITLDGPANDMLQVARAHVPVEFYLDGSTVSASVLISWGLWAIAVVAICRTLSTALANLLLDPR